jgi:hypothetical protein
LPSNVDYLLKFAKEDEAVIVNVARSLIAKADIDPDVGRALSGIFDGESEVGRSLREFFARDVDLLKRAYLAACGADDETDYGGNGFDALLDLDPGFADDWVRWKFGRKEWLSRHDESRDYSFIWRREDYRAVIGRIVEAARSEGQGHFHLSSYLEAFFVLTEGGQDAAALIARQDAFLDEMIESRHADPDFMQTIFALIRNLSPSRRRQHLATFLRYNHDFDAFASLPLEPNLLHWSGSAVPMLQGRIDFFESLLPVVNRVELLRHKQRIEHAIQGLRGEIEREKKRDFMRD